MAEGLRFRVYHSQEVEFLDYRTYSGRSFYCRSLCFLLCKAVQDLFPGSELILRRPISKGYFCNVDKPDGTAVTPRTWRDPGAHGGSWPGTSPSGATRSSVEAIRASSSSDGATTRPSCSRPAATSMSPTIRWRDTADYYYDALVPCTG